MQKILDALVSVIIDRLQRQLSNNTRLHLEVRDTVTIVRIRAKTDSSNSENVIQALKQACDKSEVTHAHSGISDPSFALEVCWLEKTCL